jgi:hypothetical protein
MSLRRHAACMYSTGTHRMDMNMQHGHEHALWTWTILNSFAPNMTYVQKTDVHLSKEPYQMF